MAKNSLLKYSIEALPVEANPTGGSCISPVESKTTKYIMDQHAFTN